MALSSYDKIGLAFTKSSEWKRLVEGFRTKLTPAGIVKYACQSYRDHEHDDHAVHVKLVLDYGKKAFEKDSTQFENFHLALHLFVDDDELNQLAEKLFGSKGHPTYFCKKEKLLKKWPDFARSQLVVANKDLIAEYEARVCAKRLEMLQMPELEQDKKRCYELAVIHDIREVVQKFYRKVGPEVLKEALDGVIMHDIMES